MPMASASPFQATTCVPRSPSTRSSGRCGWRRVNWRGSGAPSSCRPFRRRASRGLHAGDGLAGFRCFIAGGSRHRGLCHFGPVRSGAAGRNIDQQGDGARRGNRAGREPVVLESAGARKSGCGGRRKRKRGIFQAEPDHRRAAGAPPASRPGSASIPGANHFTAIAPLADPASPMVLRLKELAGARPAHPLQLAEQGRGRGVSPNRWH